MDMGYLGNRRGSRQRLQRSGAHQLGPADKDSVRDVCGRRSDRANTNNSARATDRDCLGASCAANTGDHSDGSTDESTDESAINADNYPAQFAAGQPTALSRVDVCADVQPL